MRGVRGGACRRSAELEQTMPGSMPALCHRPKQHGSWEPMAWSSGRKSSTTVDARPRLFVRFAYPRGRVFSQSDVAMHRPNAQEFLQALLETLEEIGRAHV